MTARQQVQIVSDREPLPFTSVAYDFAGAAAAVGFSAETIRQAHNAGDLTAHYVGRKPVFRAVDLDAWVQSLPTESSNERRRTA